MTSLPNILEQSMSQDLLTCTICLEFYQNPKILPCHHTFCASCLQRHLESSQSRNGPISRRFTCPACRAQVRVPIGGCADLPTDFRMAKVKALLGQLTGELQKSRLLLCAVCLSRGEDVEANHFCLECLKHYCDQCCKLHGNNQTFADHHVQSLPLAQPSDKDACPTHPHEARAYYCKSCNLDVCTLCALAEHGYHQMAPLDCRQARWRAERRLVGAQQSLQTYTAQIRRHIHLLASSEDDMKASYETSCELVHQRAEQFLEEVKVAERTLLYQLQMEYVNRKMKLNASMQKMKSRLSELTTLNTLSHDVPEIKEFDIFTVATSRLITAINDVITTERPLTKELEPEDKEDDSSSEVIMSSFHFEPHIADTKFGTIVIREETADVCLPKLPQSKSALF